MTILDVKNHLYAYFLGESVFNLKTDLGKVKLGAVYDESLEKGGKLADTKPELIRAVLDELVKDTVLVYLKEGCYILKQPLDMFPQTVVITPQTANMIADLINESADMVGYENYRSNKLAISDADISGAVKIALAFRAIVDELEDRGIIKAIEPDEDEDDFDPTIN